MLNLDNKNTLIYALKIRLIVLSFLVFSLSQINCSKEIVPEPYQPSNAHEAYRHSLEQANLIDTALGKDWIAASKNVIHKPIDISPPFQEAFYIDSTSAFAIAYQFDVLRGQRIEVDIKFQYRQRFPVNNGCIFFKIMCETSL